MTIEKEYTPEERAKIQENQILSEAEAINKGARVKPGDQGHDRVSFTEEQVDAARDEMRYDKDPAYRKMVDLRTYVRGITRDILGPSTRLAGIVYNFPTSETVIGFHQDANDLKWKLETPDKGLISDYGDKEFKLLEILLEDSVKLLTEIDDLNRGVHCGEQRREELDKIGKRKYALHQKLMERWRGFRDALDICLALYSESK